MAQLIFFILKVEEIESLAGSDMSDSTEETTGNFNLTLLDLMTYFYSINTENYTKQSIINVAKSILFKCEPENTELYVQGHFTNEKIYNQVKRRLPKLNIVCSTRQFALWLNKENEYFGSTAIQRVNGVPVKGRTLWIFKEAVEGKRIYYYHVKKL
jgi:hypothetical protein